MSAPPPYASGPQGYQAAQPVITNAPVPGYMPSYQGGQGGTPPGYQAIPVQAAPTTYVYVRGNCPACHTGNLQDEFTALGVCLAICFFPLGLLCCLMLTEKRCNHCGMTYA